jgi:tripartite-type tricarboxylate transporter receptor subunit TctC
MKRVVGNFLFIFAFIAGILSFSPAAALADYPDKQVTIFCGFAPGGAQDLTSRTMAEAVKKYFPKPMVVVNRPGATGTISASEVFKAKPDGYSIGITATTVLTLQPYRIKLPYSGPEDFTPIIKLADNPNLIAVKNDAPWKTIQEFIAYCQSNPGKARVGNSGLASELHLCAEQLRIMAKADFTSVPFSGSGESVPALLGGHIEAVSTHPNDIVGLVKAGKVKVLLVFEEKRNPLFPEAPSSLELGYDITMSVTYMFMGPKGLPPQVVTILHDAFKKGMQDPLFEIPIQKHGFILAYEGPQDLKKRLLKEYGENKKLVDLLNLRSK